jgi:hypothetical protein
MVTVVTIESFDAGAHCYAVSDTRLVLIFQGTAFGQALSKSLTYRPLGYLIATGALAQGKKNKTSLSASLLRRSALPRDGQFPCCWSSRSGSEGKGGDFRVGLPALIFAQ